MTITIKTAAGEVTAIGTPSELNEFVALLANKTATVPEINKQGVPWNIKREPMPNWGPPFRVNDWYGMSNRDIYVPPHSPILGTDLR